MKKINSYNWIIAFFLLIGIIVVSYSLAKADPYRCIDALALTTPKDCDQLEEILSGNEMIGMFMQVDGFTPAIDCLKRLVLKRKIAAFRGQGAWKDNHSFSTSESALDSYAAPFKDLEEIAKLIPVYASGACEHNLKSTYAKRLRSKVLHNCPDCKYVNTPLPGKGDFIDSLNEVHGTYNFPKAFLKYGQGYSLDGTDFSQVDFNTWKAARKDAEYLCVWGCGNNKRIGCKDGTARKERKLVPNIEYLKSQELMTYPRGYAPQIAGAKNWLKKSLLKPAADMHPNDAKGWKVMFILPYKYVNGIEILDTQKNLLQKLPYYGPYEGGGYRYYSTYFCSEVARKADESTGNEYILLSVVRRVVASNGKVSQVRDIYKAAHPCYRKEG